MDSTHGSHDTRTYLLKVWKEGSSATDGWRCSLEDPATRVRHGFEDVTALSDFLGGLYGSARSPEPAASSGAGTDATGGLS